MDIRKKAELYVIIAGAFWGLMGLGVTFLRRGGMTNLDICFIRSFIALVTLTLYALLKDKSLFKIKLKDIWCFIGTGFISLFTFNLCYFTAIEMTSIAIAVVLLYTSPAFVILLSRILFKEKITKIKVISLLVMFFGCMCVSGLFEDLNSFSPIGTLFGIASGFLYALYSVFSRFAINKGYKSETISFYTFLFASFGCSFFADFGNIYQNITYEIVFYAFVVGVIACTLPYIFYTKGLENCDNSKACILVMVEPLVAAITSYFIDGFMSYIKIFGMICMFFAVVIVNLKPKYKKI